MAGAALIIGSGPNGLAAGIVLAQAGLAVTVREAQPVAGGAVRSAELTLPGFTHDVMSAVYPMTLSSPFFTGLGLDVDWVHPEAPAAHPLDDGTAVMLERDVAHTADGLGEDGVRYRALISPLANEWAALVEDVLAPLRIPKHPVLTARMGWAALRVRSALRGVRARALFAGLAAHSCLPLEHPISAAIGLVLGISGHAVGWPLARGGAGRLATALIRKLESLGGSVGTVWDVRSLGEGLTLCDVTPQQFVKLAGERLPSSYRKALQSYKYGPGAFKMDWALDGPVPWRAKECGRAATVHVGGTYEEIAESERAVWEGRVSEKPFCLVVQPSVCDASRAPEGKQTLWAYCHVPNGSAVNMVERIEAQIERFAPGFRERILARSVMAPAGLEAANANLVGGDINGGAITLPQFLMRPTIARYRTPLRGVYLCSSSTPPGGGVHGMCGYYAAQEALKNFHSGN
jgi:phytoene dehydrogenase-like protein